MSRARRVAKTVAAAVLPRRAYSAVARYSNVPKLRAQLKEAATRARRSERRVERLVQRAADLRTANATAVARIEANGVLYLELLKRALMHTLYRPLDIGARGEYVKRELTEEEARDQGRDWPIYAQTMVGSKRLDHVQYCVETVLRDDVPGDFIETGVWRGGTCIFMRGVLKAHGDPSRVVVVADSFEGLPTVDPEKYPADAPFVQNKAPRVAARPDALVLSLLEVSQPEVRRNFELYDLLDDRVEFLQGWFKDTLPTVREREWSVIRLDGDYYESTMDGLVNLYPKLSVGGFLIVDDYSIDACRQAVHDYRTEHGITEKITTVDWTCVYWRRERR
jgi:hypothetical protein